MKACLLCRNNRESEVALQVTYSFRVVSKYVLEYVAGQDAPLSLRDVLEAPFIHGGRGLPIVPQGFPFVFAPQALIQVAYTYYLALPFLIWKSATLALLPFTGLGSLWFSNAQQGFEGYPSFLYNLHSVLTVGCQSCFYPFQDLC